MGYKLIEHIEVGSGGASSIEFTGIDGTGQDLLILLSARSAASSVRNDVSVSFNGVTTNRSYRSLYAIGSATYASSGGQISTFAGATGANATSNTFANTSIYVSNYALAMPKSISLNAVTENNATEAWQEILAGLWNSTSAITSLTLTASGSTFVQYSTASLYKITAD
jgi:hypothetical protein